jgi:tryptophanyl-tRNA synthetase
MKIFSGIQPTGALHIGNYLGAIKQWLDLQKKADCIFSIVDLHAITVPYNPKQMRENILSTAMDYLAAGLSPQKCIIFVQSHIKEHAELAWLLETMTPMGELERMTQFKEKARQYAENINAGLFAYPVLMAADILLYKADTIPVGEDQQQHVELARILARKFNNRFGKTFPEPKTLLQKHGARIMSLTDPSKKMSKTGDEGIALTDSPDTIRKKIKTAVTDSGCEIKYDIKNKAAISNLLTIYSLFASKAIVDLQEKYHGKGYADFKKDLAETIIEGLANFREKRKELEKNPQKVEKILENGAKKAQKIARQTMKEIKTKMGL